MFALEADDPLNESVSEYVGFVNPEGRTLKYTVWPFNMVVAGVTDGTEAEVAEAKAEGTKNKDEAIRSIKIRPRI
ncbi:hypothetical protein K2Q00_04095, partial [Patescibacteria group bacterium]|nr:hypothetical protein [Patescibacteria group bacterium]